VKVDSGTMAIVPEHDGGKLRAQSKTFGDKI
jgi:hypothetical protein